MASLVEVSIFSLVVSSSEDSSTFESAYLLVGAFAGTFSLVADFSALLDSLHGSAWVF
jgi:hypothetical protein